MYSLMAYFCSVNRLPVTHCVHNPAPL